MIKAHEVKCQIYIHLLTENLACKFCRTPFQFRKGAYRHLTRQHPQEIKNYVKQLTQDQAPIIDISDDDNDDNEEEQHPQDVNNDVQEDVQENVQINVNEALGIDGLNENMEEVAEELENQELQNLTLEQIVQAVQDYIESNDFNPKDWSLENIVYAHLGVDERAPLPRDVWGKLWYFLFEKLSRLPREEFVQFDFDFNAYGYERGIIG